MVRILYVKFLPLRTKIIIIVCFLIFLFTVNAHIKLNDNNLPKLLNYKFVQYPA
jgi:hypothetical protein